MGHSHFEHVWKEQFSLVDLLSHVDSELSMVVKLKMTWKGIRIKESSFLMTNVSVVGKVIEGIITNM
jgi:hypothetical protein